MIFLWDETWFAFAGLQTITSNDTEILCSQNYMISTIVTGTRKKLQNIS
jgi:hypothetical protein